MNHCPHPPRVPERITAQSTLGTKGNNEPGDRLDAVWVRGALEISRYLEGAHALSAHGRALVAFAIMWAPYGGAPSTDLLVTFGMNRTKYLSTLAGALDPKPVEAQQIQELKSRLHDEVLSGWVRGSLAHDT